MVNSLILRSSSRLEESYQTTTISSWEITLIEDTTLSRLFLSWSASRLDIHQESPSLEEITSPSKLLKFMDSMMNALENMVTLACGNTSPHCSITFLSLLSSKETFSASMVDFLHPSIPSIKLTNLIESWKCQLKDQFAISCGLTQMIDVVGVSLQEVLVTLSDKISVNSLIIPMTLS